MQKAPAPDDIPTIVAEEIQSAHQAGIPPSDQPSYVADRLRYRIAGDVAYTRKKRMTAAQRAEQIRTRFDGRNVLEPAREFDITPRRVRPIVSER